MLLGVETVTWGSHSTEFPAMIDTARQFGFEGIEFGQLPGAFESADDLKQVLAASGLQTLGFSAGSLQSRLSAVRELDPEYYYLDHIDEQLVVSLQNSQPDLTLAIHPHVHKALGNISAAAAILERHKSLKLIL